MALLDIRLSPSSLGHASSVSVILPQRPCPKGGWPTLYLLHGWSDDDSVWARRTSVERYVDGLNLAVVMPDGNLSFYTDMVAGPAYATYVCQELPELLGQWFRLSSARDKTFIAGNSMGGYGAFKSALTHPDKFGAAMAFSGVLDLVYRITQEPPVPAEGLNRVFADLDALAGGEHDLCALLEKCPLDRRPKLWARCGTSDYLLNSNRRFRDQAEKAGYPLSYSESPGDHDWAYWDANLPLALDWLTRQFSL
jgi:S-formylglutathione hydrolase FrmB